MEIQSTQYTQQIQNIQGIRSTSAANGAVKPAETTQIQRSATGKDEVSISGEGLRLSDAMKSEESAPVRFDLVNRIKREIAAGTYDTPDKMDIALDRMLSRL